VRHALVFAFVLPGCGLVAGLRTDYELGEGGVPDASDAANESASEAGEAGPKPDAGPCSDMIKDGLETDIDCGGGQCPKCTNNKACMQNSDCTSDNCSNGKCRP